MLSQNLPCATSASSTRCADISAEPEAFKIEAPGPPELLQTDRARAAGVTRPWGLFFVLLSAGGVTPLLGIARQAFIFFRRTQAGRLECFDLSVLRQIEHGACLVAIMACAFHDMPSITFSL